MKLNFVCPKCGSKKLIGTMDINQGFGVVIGETNEKPDLYLDDLIWEEPACSTVYCCYECDFEIGTGKNEALAWLEENGILEKD
jgi:hypothetical protein